MRLGGGGADHSGHSLQKAAAQQTGHKQPGRPVTRWGLRLLVSHRGQAHSCCPHPWSTIRDQ